MTWLADPQIWASFVALSALEIVLGIDNLVFIALLASRLPAAQQSSARRLGLGLALGTRIALLGSISWLAHLTDPILTLSGRPFSWRDLILTGGGVFLIYKGTCEIHDRVEGDDEHAEATETHPSFSYTVLQIVLFDIVFSIDSVITAVGIADNLLVMIAAITAAMAVMLLASDALARFLERHASVKMLALAFLLLIGMALVADGVGFHVPRGYIYAAMGFSVAVESLNLLANRNRRKRREAAPAKRGAA